MMKLFILSVLIAFSSSCLAYTCDCTKIVGQCSGSVRLSKSSGSNSNYQGEIIITSSAKSCSKVEYYINNTPYSTILNNNQDTESIFGTSPIKKEDIEFKACHVCLRKDDDGSPSNPREVKRNKFAGVWRGSLKWLVVSDNVTVTIVENNGSLSGTWSSKGHTSTLSRISTTDTSMTVVFTGVDNGAYTYIFNLITPTSASVKDDDGGMVSFSGVMNKTE
ncbi:TPA: hypothetical protein MB352_003982 [Klebsiella variicola subsp. variicola]|nr:hypothetical protein [Klebsiella variicola subsp. variicola]